MRFEELKTSEFYDFFNMSEKAREPAEDGGMRVAIEPGGFQEFIDINLFLDEREAITASELLMDRSWVGDEASLSPFAKDVAKSFIGEFASGSPACEELVFRLWHLLGKGDNVLYVDPPDLDGEILPATEEAIAVYFGSKAACQIRIPGSLIKMENIQDDGKKRLKIIIINI